MSTYLDLDGCDGFHRSIEMNEEGTETLPKGGFMEQSVADRIECWRHWYALYYPPETLTVTIAHNVERSYFFERSTTSKCDKEKGNENAD